MTSDTDPLLRRLIGGDPRAAAEILEEAGTNDDPALLVAAALLSDDAEDLLARAAGSARTTRERQLVALAAARLAGDDDLLDALVRDHLADHPDNVLAAWIASLPTPHHHQPDTHVGPHLQEPSMTRTRTTPTRASTAPTRRRTVGRWMVTFLGFPAGGLAAELLVGPVDSLAPALLGGAITGAVLGAVQAWGLGRRRPIPELWVVATSVGLMIGLGAGAAAVDYRTTLGALTVQGAICGLAVGVTQAVVLRPRLGRRALAWPPALGAIWATGWAVTTAIGVQVDDQFTVFGSSGAVVVTALTVALPLALDRLPETGPATTDQEASAA